MSPEAQQLSHNTHFIPYNYTSFSDKQIVLRLLGEQGWSLLESLRPFVKTSRSSKMLYEILGNIWAIQRNPYLEEDLIRDQRRRRLLVESLEHRLEAIDKRREKQNEDIDKNVVDLLALTDNAIDAFKSDFADAWDLRKKIRHDLSRFTHKDNIRFDPYARVSHVTDATDWRIAYPFVVITPDKESELPQIVRTLNTLGLTIIARGGGTGYTGGAVPLSTMTAVINTEKLNRVDRVESEPLPELEGEHPTVFCETGAVTKKVANAASSEGLVFAVDPTSIDSSTIGGNIAENAGGKKAVLWGTTLDNLAWWRMVDPDGNWIEVTRLAHNLGKIHTVETVRFLIEKKDGKETPEKASLLDSRVLEVPGRGFRREGLGKDVSDKFLFGLPGVQKEGCDGIITAAKFVLHRLPSHGRTVCLEFYGAASLAGPAILEISQLLDKKPEGVMLAGLEHLDDRYLHAIHYPVKSKRADYPKMVLVGDIVSDNEQALDRYTEQVVAICESRGGEGFIAKTSNARQAMWQERKKTAAISHHTNAFKLNEDVVIPLDKIGEYTTACERFNIECSIDNKVDMLKTLIDAVQGEQIKDWVLPIHHQVLADERPALSAELQNIFTRWCTIRASLDQPLSNIYALLCEKDAPAEQLEALDLRIKNEATTLVFDVVLDRTLRISWYREVHRAIQRHFGGEEFQSFRQNVKALHDKILRNRVFIALHMHAGDGNVHTNIPVNSDNPDMIAKGNDAVNLVMRLAYELKGSITGEHGIGLTKIAFIDPDKMQPFYDYLDEIDPKGHFNRGKLRAHCTLDNAYTPSFKLLGAESVILQQTNLNQISDAIKNCLRCGKCKAVCSTQVPDVGLLYSPRDKILSTSILLEAILYEKQTRRGISKRHYDSLADLSDHCTLCMKCQPPCPVKINYGEVTMKIRNFLASEGQAKGNFAKKAGLAYLSITEPNAVNISRKLLIEAGFGAQRKANQLLSHQATLQLLRPAKTTGRANLKNELIGLVNRPLPKIKVHQAARALLGLEDARYIPIVRHPDKANEHAKAVFYFPGCGNERLFPEISLATIALLIHQGVQVILPPGYLCCGYPQKGNGLPEEDKKWSANNRVLFHRMANTLNYLDIKTVLTSCGTCQKQLSTYGLEEIFTDSKLLDIHEWLLSQHWRVKAPDDTRYLYHGPCHPTFRTASKEAMNQLINVDNSTIETLSRCCGESGTFAVGRPDIATQVRFMKEKEVKLASTRQKKDGFKGTIKVLTTCPGCQQGMSRYEQRTQTATSFLAVELARLSLGENWLEDLMSTLKAGGIEKVLL